jgi:VWFA-related protein
MNKRTAILVVLAAAVAAARLVHSAPAQQDRKQDRPLRHDAAAIVKLVAVRVLGPDGGPVTGLRKEDFTLTEDGQPKTITEFEAHAMTEAGMTVTPGLPPTAEAAVRGAGAMNRKLFFFLDQQASDQPGKDKAKAAALGFLDTQIRPGDQVAVIGFYAMAGFYIREYLTSDLDRIRRAINGVTEAPPSPAEPIPTLPDDVDLGVDFSLAARNVEETLAVKSRTITATPTEGYGRSSVMAPGTAAFQRGDFVPRLAEIAEVFKTIPGPKSLILFTARNLGTEAERLGRLFGAAGTAVYAVNTQDWKMGPFGTKFKYIWTDHSLQDLSAASGGKYFADINDAAGIARDVQDLTGHYYVLGYYIRDSWEGKYHKIRVEVARPGARVLVQDGFADSKPFDQMSDFEKDLHLLELIWSDQPSFGPASLSIDPLVFIRGKTARACLLSRLEVGAKTGPPAARVEVFALLRDGTGAALVSRKWDVDLSRYEGLSIWPYLTFPVAAGACELRLAVRDRETGESCIGRARFEVAAATEEGIVLSSPLLFEAGPGALFLKLPTRPEKTTKGKPAAGEPSIMSLYRLIPKEGSPVVGEISPGTRRLLAIMPLELRPRLPGDTPILAVEAKLISLLDGGETPLEVEVREHMTYEGGPDVLAADLVLPEVAPGRYDLEITVEDIGMDRRAVVRKTLILR